jgi:hypothetical protein
MRKQSIGLLLDHGIVKVSKLKSFIDISIKSKLNNAFALFIFFTFVLLS